MSEPSSEWMKTLQRRRARASDGTVIAYEVVGEGAKTILLANGLGGRLYVWEPLVERLWRDYKIITWDYRGLFESESPASRRRLALTQHAEDAIAILREERVERAVLCGWSMGVQVSLDVAATRPEMVAGLVLINGTYGHALSTFAQPLFSAPISSKPLHWVLEWLQHRPQYARVFSKLMRLGEVPTAVGFALTAGPDVARHRRILRQYFDDVLGPSFGNYLRLFQELDAHSMYHLLPEITAPALVISGALDLLTPARQSYEMARRLPDAEHLAIARGSHFVLVERPELVIPAIARFVTTRARW